LASEKSAGDQKTQQHSSPPACENNNAGLPTLMTSSSRCQPKKPVVCMTTPACDVAEPLAVRITTPACGVDEPLGHLLSFTDFGSSPVHTAKCHVMLATTRESSLCSLTSSPGDNYPQPTLPLRRTVARRSTPCYSEGNHGTLKRRLTPYYLDNDVDTLEQRSTPYNLDEDVGIWTKHLLRDSDVEPWVEAETFAETFGESSQTLSTCSSVSPVLRRRGTPYCLDVAEPYDLDVASSKSTSQYTFS